MFSISTTLFYNVMELLFKGSVFLIYDPYAQAFIKPFFPNY